MSRPDGQTDRQISASCGLVARRRFRAVGVMPDFGQRRSIAMPDLEVFSPVSVAGLLGSPSINCSCLSGEG